MIDVFHCEVELIFVMLSLAAVFGSAIGQNAQQRNILFLKERKNAIVQHVGGHQCIFAVIELGKATLV